MKKFIARLLTFLIFNRNKRRYFRNYLMHLNIQDFCNLYKFLKMKTRKNSVLLVEVNNTHGEVIGGYLKYFQDIGYNVDILVNPIIVKENPFCRLDISNVFVFMSDFSLMKFFLASRKFYEYKHIILMSSAAYFYCVNGMYMSVLNYYPQLRKHHSLFIVEHDLNDINRFNERSFCKQKHLITLGHFPQTVFASPLLFGSINITQKGKKTVFICVGGIQQERKDHQKLISAIKELVALKQNFKVVVVGKGKLENLPEEIRSYIEITGRLNFSEMFRYMEEADFYLPLLNPENFEHNRYITTGVTGSAQLIYAFGKIPVIHPHFAPFYGFDNENAIISKDLTKGMQEAITIDQQGYKKKQIFLMQLFERLKMESLNNFKEILSQ